MTERRADPQSPDRDRLRHRDAHSSSDMGTDTHTRTPGGSGTDTHKIKGDSHEDTGQRHGRGVQDTHTRTRTWGHVSQAETQPQTDSDQPGWHSAPRTVPLSWAPGEAEPLRAGGWLDTQPCPCLANPEWLGARCRYCAPCVPRGLLCSEPPAAMSPCTPTTRGRCNQRHLCADKSTQQQRCEAPSKWQRRGSNPG